MREIEYAGNVITVQRATVRHRIGRSFILSRLGVFDGEARAADEEFIAALFFARLMTQTEGELGIPRVGRDSTADEIRASFEAFLDADESLYDVVGEAINTADAPVGDPDTAPVSVKKKTGE